MVIQVPITPANLKYLRYRYQISDILYLNRTNPIGHFIQELLRPKSRQFYPTDTSSFPVLNVVLLADAHYSYFTHLPNSFIPLFNQFVKDLMHQEYIAHMEALEGFFENQEAIIMFIDKFGFDEHEVSFEALKKYHLRYRTRDQKKKELTAEDKKTIKINPQLSLFKEISRKITA